MATISERLAYILTFDTKSGVKSLEDFGRKSEDELGKAQRKQEQLNATMAKAGAAALAFAGIAGVGLFKMAQGANNAQQNMEALEQVVGDLEAKKLGEWAEDSAEGVGLASQKAVAAVTSFAQLGKMAGVTGQDLNQFSTGLVQMAADFAAFKNVRPEQALQDIRSGFSGSVEVMRKYGIFLDDITLKAAFFRETGEKVTGTLTGQQKVIAVNSELYRQGADMLGQWGRESDQLQGRTAVLQANLQNLSDNIGAGIMPAMTGMVGGLATLAGGMASMDANTGHFVGTAALVVVAVSGVTGALLVSRAALIKTAAAWRTMGAAARTTMIATAAVTAVLVIGAAVYESYASKKREAKTATNDFAAALQAEKDGQEGATNAAIARMLSGEDFIEQAKQIGISQVEIARFVQGHSVPALEALIAAESTLTEDMRAQNFQFQEAAQEYGISTGALRDFVQTVDFAREAVVSGTSEFGRQTDAMRAQDAATNALTGSYGLVTASIEKALAVMRPATTSIEEQEEAARKAAETDKLWAKELDRVADASQDAVEATRDLMDAQLEAVRQTFDLRKSNIAAELSYMDLIAAIEENDKVQKDGNKTTEEKKRSELELSAQRLQAVDEIAAVAEEYAREKGAIDNTIASSQLQITELIRQAGMYPELRTEIDEYITKLEDIPGVVPTHVQILLDSGELDDLARALQLLELLAGQHTATVTILDAGGPEQASRHDAVEPDPPPRRSTPSGVRIVEQSSGLTINMNGAIIGTPPQDLAIQLAETAALVQAGNS